MCGPKYICISIGIILIVTVGMYACLSVYISIIGIVGLLVTMFAVCEAPGTVLLMCAIHVLIDRLID